jgi:uncharacterized protein (TIGR00255 family)
MTGFARVRKNIPEGEIVLSLKSVNHRGLDLHFHLPPEMDPIESSIRGIVKEGLSRGHVQIHLNFSPATEQQAAPLNRVLLETWLRAFREAAEAYQLEGTPDLNAALRLPGMLTVTAGQDVSHAVEQAILGAARDAVALLNTSREREGAAMAAEMLERCAAICDLASRIENIRTGAIPAFQKRLRERLADLLNGAGIDPQRLAQEVALLADRSDISEELIRLKTHAVQLREILRGSGEMGKRLDFLLQEMNRESNTILSKTGGLGDLGLTITDLALAAKSEIDKIREQSLNVE